VYNARSLPPAKFLDIKVPVLNVEKRSQLLTKGTDLGVLHRAEVLDEYPEETMAKSARIKEDTLSPPENEAIQKMMANLPEELNEE